MGEGGEPEPLAGLEAIPLYVPGKSGGKRRAENPVRLASNEGAFGASPSVQEAMAQACARGHRYPPPGGAGLASALSKHYGLAVERLVCGAGSDELIALLVRAYAAPQDKVLHVKYGFLVHRLASLGVRAVPMAIDLDEARRLSHESLAKLCNEFAPKLVFFANPENPLGTTLDCAAVSEVLRIVPDQTLVVMDCAYSEYTDGAVWAHALKLAHERKNFVLLRTFSKIYGLAGLRVGWAYAPTRVAETLHRVRGVFNVSLPAEQAAIAALEDRDGWVEKSRLHNDKMRLLVRQGLEDLQGVGVSLPPQDGGNFLLFDTPVEGAVLAAHLAEQGVFLRDLTAYNLPHSLRITLGTEEECGRALLALRSSLEFFAEQNEKLS